jgi:hypothetical protein
MNKSVFFFYKIGVQESRSCLGVGTSGRGGGWILCKYCVHMYVNGKMRPVQTIPGMWKGRKKGNDGGGTFN